MKSVLSVGVALLLGLLVANAFVPGSVEAAQRATATPSTSTYYVTAAANGRECPELTCDVIEKYVAGEAVEVVDEAEGDTVRGSDLWYEVRVTRRSTVFIHSSLLTDRKPTAQATRRSNSGGNGSTSSTPVVESTVVQNATSVPTEAVATWSCAGDIYNCSDFSSRGEVDSYFAACPGDPSGLDGDNDGIPCESL